MSMRGEGAFMHFNFQSGDIHYVVIDRGGGAIRNIMILLPPVTFSGLKA